MRDGQREIRSFQAKDQAGWKAGSNSRSNRWHRPEVPSRAGLGRKDILSLVKAGAAVTALTAGFGVGVAWLYTHPFRKMPNGTRLQKELGIPYEPVTLRTRDDLSLAGWYTPGTNGALILTAHGWGTCRLVEIHALFARHGYGVLSWDFRAHGESQGNICSAGFLEAMDVEAALDFALDQSAVSWIGFWGGSMGGTAGLHAASRRPEIKAIVLDSVPADVKDALKARARFTLATYVAKQVAETVVNVKISNLQPLLWLSQFAPRPSLIVQGLADHTLGHDPGHRLYVAAGENATLWLEPGQRHLAMADDVPEKYEQRLIDFFDEAYAKS